MNKIVYNQNIIHERFNEISNSNNKNTTTTTTSPATEKSIIQAASSKIKTQVENVTEISFRKLTGIGKQKSSFVSPIKLSTSRVLKKIPQSENPMLAIEVISITTNRNMNLNDDVSDSNESPVPPTNNEKLRQEPRKPDTVEAPVHHHLPRSKYTLQRPKLEFDDDYVNHSSSNIVTTPDRGIDSPVVIFPRKKVSLRLCPPQLNTITTTKLSPRVAVLKKKVSRKSSENLKNETSLNSLDDINDNSNSSNQLLDLLSSFEREEVRSYSRIHFVSDMCSKIENNKDLPNFGFDNKHGDYIVCKNDHIKYRYQILDILGRGSFSLVVKCKDHLLGDEVAIKIIRNRDKFKKQAAIESSILSTLKQFYKEKEDNPDFVCSTIDFKDCFDFRSHQFLVFPVIGSNLYQLLKRKKEGFSMNFVRSVAIQLIASLVHLRTNGIVHCDLKLENILLKDDDEKNCKIVIIDFGSSCYENNTIYPYIQSRFYRAPEVLMGLKYSFEIDMWSLGCILPELRSGSAAFPGLNEQDQLACIAELLNEPPNKMVESCSRKDLFNSDGSIKLVPNNNNQVRVIGSRSIQHLINARTKDKQFVNFLEGTLRWDPKCRLSPSDAKNHPWLQ